MFSFYFSFAVSVETLKSTINSYTMSSTNFCDNGKEMLIIIHELYIVFKPLQKSP